MADSSKKDTPVKDSTPEGGKKEEEKPAVVEEVISIEDGQSDLSLTGLASVWKER